MKPDKKTVLPLIFLFIILNGFFLSGKTLLDKWGIDRDVVLIANLLFFLVSFVAFFIQQKGLKNKNPHAFVRSVMGSMMIRMFLVLVALGVYLFIVGKNVNKPAVFVSLFLYMLYMVVEVAIMMKMNRRSNG
ncbi:MAG: hypothetical protein ABJA78_15265 [Ferruginibacter sp.]